MPVKITTAGVAAHERPDFWRQCLRDTLRVDCDVRPLDDAPLEIECALFHFGRATLIDGSGGAFHLRRRADIQANFVNLLFNLEGHCVIRHDDRAIELAPGSHTLLPLRETGECRCTNDFRHLGLILPEASLDAHVPDWRAQLATPLSSRTDAGILFTDFIHCLLTHGAALEGPAAERIADSLVSLLAGMLEAGRNASPDKSSRFETYHRQRIRRFICENLRNPSLNIDLIANGVGLSPRYVHRLFADEACTPMEWVWRQRLEKAAHELSNAHGPTRSIGDVAYSWGFNDQAHFSRSFRKHFKLTPREFRDNARTAATERH